MAINTFYQLCEEILAARAGGSFHDSYFGDQVRPKNNSYSSINYRENLRKGKFSFLKTTWKNLSGLQRNSFISAAGSLELAMRLFVIVSINLILCEQPVITTFIPSAAPIAFPLSIVLLTNAIFTIQATGPMFTVPVNKTLLLYATYEKQVSKVFDNPQNYSPIKFFGSGTDLTLPFDIVINWKAYFGQLTPNKKICIKSVLISDLNGTSGNESIICSTVTHPETYFIINDDGTFIIDAANTFIISQ